jgi:hypothetical protein
MSDPRASSILVKLAGRPTWIRRYPTEGRRCERLRNEHDTRSTPRTACSDPRRRTAVRRNSGGAGRRARRSVLRSVRGLRTPHPCSSSAIWRPASGRVFRRPTTRRRTEWRRRIPCRSGRPREIGHFGECDPSVDDEHLRFVVAGARLTEPGAPKLAPTSWRMISVQGSCRKGEVEDPMLASDPADRLHNQHPPPPTSIEAGSPTATHSGGPIPRLRGSKLHAETHRRWLRYLPRGHRSLTDAELQPNGRG